MKRKYKRVMQFALLLIIVSVIGNMLMYSFNLSPFNLAVIDHTRSISASNVTDIRIMSNTGDVNIVPYDGTEIVVHMKGKSEKRYQDNYRLSVEENGSEITIEAEEFEKKRLFVINSGAYELLVQLPQKEYEKLQVHTDLADINVEKIQTKQSFLESSLGGITANKLQGDIYSVTGLGNINVQLQAFESDIDAQTSLGNITITTEIAPAAIQTNLRSGLGERTIELPGLSNVDEASLGTGGPKVKLSTELGDLALLMADH
ncbi:DUF4097 and DUF4098 domain-containing protein YvlB [Paenibacillus sp. DS2015]|uniref:DUF4097 family beta strand repeat-containing protein n=1 Tax=Paenibacillus sp. DS2015 TaxID=3373917 RepID=UPI003D1EED28